MYRVPHESRSSEFSHTIVSKRTVKDMTDLWYHAEFGFFQVTDVNVQETTVSGTEVVFLDPIAGVFIACSMW